MVLGAARELYRLSREQATGRYVTRERVAYFNSGWIHGVSQTKEMLPRGEDRLARLLAEGSGKFTAGNITSLDAASRCIPFHPSLTVRQHLDKVGRALGSPQEFRQQIAGRPFKLRHEPHPTCLDPDEKPVLRWIG